MKQYRRVGLTHSVYREVNKSVKNKDRRGNTCKGICLRHERNILNIDS